MRWKSVVFCLAALSVAACASTGARAVAPTAAPGAAQASGFTQAGAREAAEAVVAGARLDGVFRPSARQIGASHFAQVVHPASGLTCTWGPVDRASLTQFQPLPETLPNANVACSVQSGVIDSTTTVYATRFAAPTTLEDQLSASQSAIEQTLPDLKPAAPLAQKSPIWAGFPAPPYVSAAYTVGAPGGAYYTAVAVAMVDGWVIKMRYSGPLGVGPDRADSAWAAALNDVLKNKPSL